MTRKLTANYLPEEKAMTIQWQLSDERNRHMVFAVRMPTESWNYYLPTGIDYHDTVPHYAGHTPIEDCTFVGGPCYCDGSSLAATKLWNEYILTGNEEVIWKELESWHADKFPL